MTGYTVHTGASKKFVSGWDRVFSGKAEETAGKESRKKTQDSSTQKKKK